MTKNATTDEDGKRYYQWQGRHLLSVTTLRRVIGTAFELVAWQINQVLAATITMQNEIGMVDPSDEKAVSALKTALRREANTVRDRAADQGKKVHKAAEDGLHPDSTEPEVQPFLRQYYDAMKVLDLKVLLSERQCWHLTLGYAGTFDIVGYVTPPGLPTRLALVDIKSGRGTYVDHVLQLCAYCAAEFVGQDNQIDQEATDLLHAVDTLAILHLRPDHWEYLEIRVEDSTMRAFGNMVRYATWLDRNKSIDPHITLRVTGSGKGN